MIKLFILLLVPVLASAQEAAEVVEEVAEVIETAPSYQLTPGGWAFMIIAWISIVVWNVLCFRKILGNK
ncbi:MAG: hypothetical protein ACRCY4_01770 [Brevinema sp.]